MKKALFLFLVALTTTQASSLAFELTFDSIASWDPIGNKFSMVHFTLPNTSVNNFQGGFFWLPTKQLPISSWVCGGQSHNYMQWCVTFNAVSKPCSKQVRWLYYTNAKWSRLWPLDQQSLNWLRLLNADYNNLQVNGGLYTSCGTSWSTEIYSIYGQIEYYDTVLGTWLGTLSAWLTYDIANNLVDTTKWLFPNFQYFNNQTPLWYIYDNVGGIWFVGWLLPPAAHSWVINTITNSGSRNINNIFGVGPAWFTLSGPQYGWSYVLTTWINAGIDTIWNISVLGNVLLSRWGLNSEDRQSILGNPSRNSSIVFSDVINTSDILNTLRKNSDAACRWQIKVNEGGDLNTVLGTYWLVNAKTVCVFNNNGWSDFNLIAWSDSPLVIDLTNETEFAGKEIIVKGRNVVLDWSMAVDAAELNLFVDNGNVLLRNGDFATEVVAGNMNSLRYAVFDAQGSMVNDYYEAGPILNSYAWQTAIPWWSNYFSTVRSNTDQPVSARRVYDSMLAISWAGNTWALAAVNFGVFLRWNIFINGLLVWGTAWNLPTGIVNKYYLHGRLASLNTALEPSIQRKTLINDIFGTYWATQLQNYINFATVFGWQCLLNWYAADSYGTQTQQPCKVSNDTFKFNPFVLINTWVPSRLLP